MPESRRSFRHRSRWGSLGQVSVLLSLLTGLLQAAVRPVAAAELLEIQLEGLEIPVRLDELEAWSRSAAPLPDAASGSEESGDSPRSAPPAGTPARPGPPRGAAALPEAASPDAALPAAAFVPGQAQPLNSSDLKVWLNLLEPDSRRSLTRLLRAPLLRDRSFGSQLLDSWAGGQMLAEVGDLLTTSDGRSTAPELHSTLRQLLRQRREVTVLALLRALPEPRLRLRLDALLSLAEQWRRQIEQQAAALSALQALQLPSRSGRPLIPAEPQQAARRVLLPVPHRQEPLPVDLWPARGPAAAGHPWLLVLPGLGGNADQLGWFAGALAQRGWSVAVPQHPGSDGQALREALDGRSPPPGAATLATRLQDVEAVFRARRQGQLDLPGTGVVLVGHSLGGLTALLAAGMAPAPGLEHRCGRAIERLPIGNPSRLLQCELVTTGVPAALQRPADLRGLVLFNSFGSLLWPDGLAASAPVPLLIVGGSLDLVTPPLEEQLQLFLPAGDPRSRLVLVEGGSHFSPVRMVERQEAVLRLGRDLVGADPATVQTLLLGLGTEFLHSLELPLLLPAQVRSQAGVRAYVLDPATARRWRGRLRS